MRRGCCWAQRHPRRAKAMSRMKEPSRRPVLQDREHRLVGRVLCELARLAIEHPGPGSLDYLVAGAGPAARAAEGCRAWHQANQLSMPPPSRGLIEIRRAFAIDDQPADDRAGHRKIIRQHQHRQRSRRHDLSAKGTWDAPHDAGHQCDQACGRLTMTQIWLSDMPTKRCLVAVGNGAQGPADAGLLEEQGQARRSSRRR